VRLRCLRREGGDLRKMLLREMGSGSLDGMEWDGMGWDGMGGCLRVGRIGLQGVRAVWFVYFTIARIGVLLTDVAKGLQRFL
jgi:hypothetical protein